ncbi:unnamed protein product [Enterobius vermicularis]|uniref:Pyruvate kinase n=1 Tax=Enterobius vermicularis TaxID=51028 RepID=A0A0N4VPL6_ENTVE|nr:unnamed protein product [Enterobius vermicularis]
MEPQRPYTFVFSATIGASQTLQHLVYLGKLAIRNVAPNAVMNVVSAFDKVSVVTADRISVGDEKRAVRSSRKWIFAG